MNFFTRLFLRFRDRHDSAWAPTGYSRKFDHVGHDEAKASDAARRADLHAKRSRKAAADRALPKAPRKRLPANVAPMRKTGTR